MRDLSIEPTDFLSPMAQALVQALNAELSALYPEQGANHFRLDPEELAEGRGAFVVPGDGDLIGKVMLLNADQDMVFANFIGQVMDDGSYAATLIIVGGAGQFTGASGTADLCGEFFDDGSFSFNFDGTITY